MLPCFSMEDVANDGQADSVSSSDRGHGFTGFDRCHDERDIRFGEFCIRMGTSGGRAMTFPASAIHSVISHRSKTKVLRIDTLAIITGMPDAQTDWDLPLMQEVGESMGSNPFSANPDSPISGIRTWAIEGPALVWSAFFGEDPNPIFGRFLDLLGGEHALNSCDERGYTVYHLSR